MICNCAEETDSNCLRPVSFIRKLLNLNGNSEYATLKRKKRLRHQMDAVKYPVILSRVLCSFRKMQRI